MTLASEIAGRLMKLPRAQTRDVLVERDLEVPMRDGAVLLADRYSPRGVDRPPTLLVRSPYGRSGIVGLLLGRLWAERGFQAVVQSVRGTFGSGGEFNPFDEQADGMATIDWLERQPWHVPGRLGMTGPSYVGLTQWAVAREAGDRVRALTPQVTASQFHGMAFGSGGVALDTGLSWLLVLGLQERRLGVVRIPVELRRRLPRVFRELPIGELDVQLLREPVPYWREWLDHASADDPYWSSRDFSAGVAEVQAAVQLVGGWHDIFLPWLVEDFRALRAAGRETQLIVGPWSHASPALAGYGTRSALGWLRAQLLGDRRLVRKAAVAVYVQGAGEWRQFDEWPPAGARERRLHLLPGGRLGSETPPDGAAPGCYRYDPHDPTPAVGGPVLMEARPVVDNRRLEARSDVLTYTSEPLTEDLEAIGPVGAEVHVRSSLPHFDVFVRVCDVHPGGPSLNVCDALVRVTPDDFDHADDGSVRVRFPLWPTAYRFRAGHAIRVQVSSGAHPRYARNPGTGEPPATATRLVAADQEVLHDAQHPSAVTLSVV